MSGHDASELRTSYDAAFIHPFADHSWESKRGRSFWIELEILQDRLAGPLWSIVNYGGCAYVYAREDAYFTGVSDPATLQARLDDSHGQLVAHLGRFVPTSLAEEKDLLSMRRFAAQMWAVAEKAIAIEETRWKDSKPDS